MRTNEEYDDIDEQLDELYDKVHDYARYAKYPELRQYLLELAKSDDIDMLLGGLVASNCCRNSVMPERDALKRQLKVRCEATGESYRELVSGL